MDGALTLHRATAPSKGILFTAKGLFPSVRRDQHVVGDRFEGESDGKGFREASMLGLPRLICAAIAADHMGPMVDAWCACIAGPSIGLGGGVPAKIGGGEGMQADGREVLDLGQTDAVRRAVFDLARASDQELALGAATTPTGHEILLAAAGRAAEAVGQRALIT